MDAAERRLLASALRRTVTDAAPGAALETALAEFG
ncbi:hypothetical protein FrEUN1fDRAFT_5485 [Parafrankia sp. EUN1f]|nr:hypothetical protein FrEUN1fDRAFT_5485 [Parafrankia sp. EUN1f]